VVVAVIVAAVVTVESVEPVESVVNIHAALSRMIEHFVLYNC
jgi:hypothetical protein